jgi:hypothetical protein
LPGDAKRSFEVQSRSIAVRRCFHVVGPTCGRTLSAGQTDSAKSGGWLYQGGSSKDRPADLGFYMGYRICAAYHAASAYKRKAIHAMLNIEDFGGFLTESGYMRDDINL